MENLTKDDQFQKLTLDEKYQVISDLVLNPEDILCKSAKDLFVARPESSKSADKLYVKMIQKNLNIPQGEELICQFLYKKEKLYIFKCHFSLESGLPCLILDSNFYMIQRRGNYRLKFPTTISSKVVMKNPSGQLIGKVFDLSTTGIRVSSSQNTNSIKVGDEVDVEIQVAGHDNLTLKSHLRHRNENSETFNDKKTTVFYFGLQFHNLTHDDEKRLARINMELYRNFLQKVGS